MIRFTSVQVFQISLEYSIFQDIGTIRKYLCSYATADGSVQRTIFRITVLTRLRLKPSSFPLATLITHMIEVLLLDFSLTVKAGLMNA